jgi:hypothetical protein
MKSKHNILLALGKARPTNSTTKKMQMIHLPRNTSE